MTLAPRFNRLHRIADDERATHEQVEGLFRSGRLVDVDEFGGLSVELQGRAGATARIDGLGTLVDSPESLLGLRVFVLAPTGHIRNGGLVIGASSPVTPLADFVELASAGNFLEGRDRALTGDTPAWTGTAFVPERRTLQITGVRLIAETVENGLAVLEFEHGTTTTKFTQISADGVAHSLAPLEPLVISAGSSTELVRMTLRIARFGGLIGGSGFDDALLQVPYATESQAESSGSAQRLRINTTTGAGLPYLTVLGRLN